MRKGIPISTVHQNPYGKAQIQPGEQPGGIPREESDQASSLQGTLPTERQGIQNQIQRDATPKIANFEGIGNRARQPYCQDH
jgi:hypothetical protein